MSSQFIYYVYAYLRNKDSKTAKAGTPYYIGKGNGTRYKGKHRRIPVPTDNEHLKIIASNLSQTGACAIERRLIAWYGRKDIKTGILLNLTDGGEGTRGYHRTDAEKRNISAKLKGRPKSESHKAALRKAKAGGPPEHIRRQISAKLKGNIPWNKGKVGVQQSTRRGLTGIYDEETRFKMGAGSRGNYKSDEFKLAHSERMKKWWADRKANSLQLP